MRVHSLLLLVPLLLQLVSSLPPPSLQQQFNSWKTFYSVAYATPAEELRRFSIWTANFHRVSEHNARADAGKRSLSLLCRSELMPHPLPPPPPPCFSGLSSYRMRMNSFAHLSPAEFRRTRLGLARGDLAQRR
jgi:hypothetical protein